MHPFDVTMNMQIDYYVFSDKNEKRSIDDNARLCYRVHVTDDKDMTFFDSITRLLYFDRVCVKKAISQI